MGRLADCPALQSLNVAIFSNTINVISVKLCMVSLLCFTISYHLRWPWVYLKVIAVSKSFNWNFYVLIQLSWDFSGLLSTSEISWVYYLKNNNNNKLLHAFNGEKWHIFSFKIIIIVIIIAIIAISHRQRYTHIHELTALYIIKCTGKQFARKNTETRIHAIKN